MSPNIF